jgi:hypothetical protein
MAGGGVNSRARCFLSLSAHRSRGALPRESFPFPILELIMFFKFCKYVPYLLMYNYKIFWDSGADWMGWDLDVGSPHSDCWVRLDCHFQGVCFDSSDTNGKGSVLI